MCKWQGKLLCAPHKPSVPSLLQLKHKLSGVPQGGEEHAGTCGGSGLHLVAHQPKNLTATDITITKPMTTQ